MNNNLEGNDLDILCNQVPDIYKLKLSNNKITDINNLQKLKNLNGLIKLFVEGNPFVSVNADYKEKLFEMLPNLQSIDGVDKDGNQVEETEYDEEDGEEDDVEADEKFDEEEMDEMDEEEDFEEDDGELDEEDDDFEDEEEEEEDNKHKKQKK